MSISKGKSQYRHQPDVHVEYIDGISGKIPVGVRVTDYQHDFLIALEEMRPQHYGDLQESIQVLRGFKIPTANQWELIRENLERINLALLDGHGEQIRLDHGYWAEPDALNPVRNPDDMVLRIRNGVLTPTMKIGTMPARLIRDDFRS